MATLIGRLRCTWPMSPVATLPALAHDRFQTGLVATSPAPTWFAVSRRDSDEISAALCELRHTRPVLCDILCSGGNIRSTWEALMDNLSGVRLSELREARHRILPPRRADFLSNKGKSTSPQSIAKLLKSNLSKVGFEFNQFDTVIQQSETEVRQRAASLTAEAEKNFPAVQQDHIVPSSIWSVASTTQSSRSPIYRVFLAGYCYGKIDFRDRYPNTRAQRTGSDGKIERKLWR